MIVHYYEASALTHSGNAPGLEVTLEDRHKTAWRLFSGKEYYAGQRRDFIFRTDRLSDSQEIYRLRSTVPFAHGAPLNIDLSEGRVIPVEWIMTPLIAVKDPARNNRGKRRQAPKDRWDEVVRGDVGRRGFSIANDRLNIAHVGHLRQFPDQKARCDILCCRATLVVTDPLKAANAWMSGTAKMRAYGMGMMSLAKGIQHD